MGGPIDSINNAILTNHLDRSKWEIEEEDLCKRAKRPGFEGNIEDLNLCVDGYVGISASYKTQNGQQQLTFSGLLNKQTKKFSLQWLHYSTSYEWEVNTKKHRNIKQIGIADGNTDNPNRTVSHSDTIHKPDGKISLYDIFRIQDDYAGDVETYILSRARVPNTSTEIFELSDAHLRVKKPSDKIYKYHGLQFTKKGDNWFFFGPENRKKEGMELQNFLEGIGKQYSSILTEAEKNIIK